jgi:hypothetical protein
LARDGWLSWSGMVSKLVRYGWAREAKLVRDGVYTVKKVPDIPVSSRDVTNQTPPGQE